MPTPALCHVATHYTHFQYQLVVDRIAPPGDAIYPNGAVVYKEYGRNQNGYVHVNKYGQEPGDSDLFLNEAHMADFNGDGLTDLLFSDYRASAPDPNSTVVQFLNLGTRMQSDSGAEQREGDDLIERKHIHVFDVNGDGRDDLVLPGGTNAPDVFCRGFFVERRTEKDGRLPATDNGRQALGKIPTGEINNWARFFSDFDGDGTTDHAAWQIFSSNGGGGGQAGGQDDNLITASSQDCGRGSICTNGGGSPTARGT